MGAQATIGNLSYLYMFLRGGDYYLSVISMSKHIKAGLMFSFKDFNGEGVARLIIIMLGSTSSIIMFCLIIKFNPMDEGSIVQIFNFEREAIKECRICLQDMHDREVRKFCACKGSVKSVHENCLLDWVRNDMKRGAGFSEYAICEICKEKIFLRVEKSCALVNCGDMCSSLFCTDNYQGREQAIAAISVMVICLVLMVSLILSIMSQPTNRVIVNVTIAAGTIFLLSLMYFIGKFVIVINRVILGVRERFDRRLGDLKIVPIQ